MLDFTFTEEQILFRRTVREWCSKYLTLEKVREMDSKQEISMEVIKGLADLGLLLMTVPEEHGGVGADWVTACIAAEELAYADISIAVPVLFLVETAWGFVVDKYGTERIREEVIRKAAKGEKFLGIAITESGGGSDVAAIKSNIRKEGNEWRANGEKTYISGTEEALKLGGGYFCNAYSDRERGHRGMTAFYLPINAKGVEVTKRFDDLGRMAISTGGFTMDDVRIPENYLIGEENRGFYYTMEGFDMARLLIGATSVGCAQRALEIGMDYIKERKLFGRPIGKFQGIHFELADNYTDLEALRALVYKTAWITDERYKRKRFTPLENAKWISMVKLKGPHLAFNIIRDVMLWHGAFAYTKECPLEMALRAILSYCIGAEGTKNIQKIVIARELLGRDFMAYR